MQHLDDNALGTFENKPDKKKKKEKKVKKEREVISVEDESDEEKQELFKNITLHLTNEQKKGIIPII
jgi:uncharacterized membrane-anchored protein